MLQYTMISVELDGRSDFESVAGKISELKGLTVVNIVSPLDGEKLFFCPENLEGILACAPDKLSLEVVPEDQYLEVVLNHIRHLAACVEQLRDRLYVEYVSNLFAEVEETLGLLESAVSFLSCHVLQNTASPFDGIVDKMQQLEQQIRLDSFCSKDNVRCTDHLQYELLPQLYLILHKSGGA